jgi:predicted transcriptional regulator of viral defense system
MSTDWSALYELAASQDGHFTTPQAAEAGYSRPLLDHHVASGRFLRVQRGIYRLRDFPIREHEDHVVAFLWSHGEGVLSHETALMLHDLSDAFPSHIHLTVPSSWRHRRVKIPALVHVHYGDVAARERQWSGPVPVTRPLRTLQDCVEDHVAPDLIDQAVRSGPARGLFTRAQLAAVGVPA